MTPEKYIAAQAPERQKLLQEIHSIIVLEDKTVVPMVEPMMGIEMIVYKAPGTFKYGLAANQKYMSLHVLPMYMNPLIYDRYKALLKDARFQKGCINFSEAGDMPLKIVTALIRDCSKIDLQKVREEYLASKKKSVKGKA